MNIESSESAIPTNEMSEPTSIEVTAPEGSHLTGRVAFAALFLSSLIIGYFLLAPLATFIVIEARSWWNDKLGPQARLVATGSLIIGNPHSVNMREQTTYFSSEASKEYLGTSPWTAEFPVPQDIQKEIAAGACLSMVTAIKERKIVVLKWGTWETTTYPNDYTILCT